MKISGRANREAIKLTLSDLKGINPCYLMHKILIKDEFKLVA